MSTPTTETDKTAPTLRQARLRALGLTISAPVAAFAFAMIVIVIVVFASGFQIGAVFDSVGETMSKGRNVVNVINLTGAYYLSALAVAIGFRMNLFNIGVEGQYRLAALVAAYVGGQIAGIPGFLQIILMVLSAIVTGAIWAGIAGVLKVTRGVSEVIATIMLNAIAVALIGFLLRDGHWSPDPAGRRPSTKEISEAGWFPDLSGVVNPILKALGFDAPPQSTKTYGFILVAIVVGVIYAFLLRRTRFGFDLRATGQNPAAAAASGVSAKRMAIYAMLISGGIAGMVGMAELLGGNEHQFTENFISGFGFTGIAVALLGRNSPVGMFIAAIIWAFLDTATRGFQIIGISNKLSAIMQAVVLLAVVIAYTVVSRKSQAAEARSVAASTQSAQPPQDGESSITDESAAGTVLSERRESPESPEPQGPPEPPPGDGPQPNRETNTTEGERP